MLLGLASFEDEQRLLHTAPAGANNDRGGAYGWKVLPAGTPVQNPGVLLGRSELASAIDRARAEADFVVVEAPRAEMSEAFPVAALSDGILLVAEMPGTTRDDAAGARHTLGPPYGSARLAMEPRVTIVSTAAAGDPARRRSDAGSPAPARSAG